MRQTQENSYVAPDVEIVSVRVENGFAASGPNPNLPSAADNDLGTY